MSRTFNTNIKNRLLFQCPNDGMISRDDVDVWCNSCEKEEMVYKDHMYLCPSCLVNTKGNFSCRICGSNKVKLGQAKIRKSKHEHEHERDKTTQDSPVAFSA